MLLTRSTHTSCCTSMYMSLVSHRRHLLFCDNCEIHAIKAAEQQTTIRRRWVAFRFHFWVWFFRLALFKLCVFILFIAIDACTWGLFLKDSVCVSDAITMTSSELNSYKRKYCRYYLTTMYFKQKQALIIWAVCTWCFH